MYCHFCGKQLAPNSAFCNICGVSVRIADKEEPLTTGSTSSFGTHFVREQQGEQTSDPIFFQVRPAFYEVGFSYAIAALLSLLVAGLTGILGGPFQIVIATALVFFLFPIYKHIQRNRIVYTLSPGRIEIESGLLSRTTRNIPLRNIQDVTTSASIGQRLLGLGDVVIDSASDAGKITMRNVRNPRRYADIVLAQLHRWN